MHNTHPYEHKEWSGDLNELLQVTFTDVFSYLVFGVKKQGRWL